VESVSSSNLLRQVIRLIKINIGRVNMDPIQSNGVVSKTKYRMIAKQISFLFLTVARAALRIYLARNGPSFGGFRGIGPSTRY